MPDHRTELQSYGHPLPSRGTYRVADRRPRIPDLLARARMAQPQPAPEQIPSIPRRRPTVPTYETSDARQILTLVQAYARGRRTVVLTYQKATEGGRVVTREIEPYSLRYKDTRTRGRVRYLYGFCLTHNEIHMFLVPNIVNVRGTQRSFVPRWVVEF